MNWKPVSHSYEVQWERGETLALNPFHKPLCIFHCKIYSYGFQTYYKADWEMQRNTRVGLTIISAILVYRKTSHDNFWYRQCMYYTYAFWKFTGMTKLKSLCFCLSLAYKVSKMSMFNFQIGGYLVFRISPTNFHYEHS